MGLEERRKIKELQDVTLPGRVKEIEEICGKPIPYEVVERMLRALLAQHARDVPQK